MNSYVYTVINIGLVVEYNITIVRTNMENS